MVLERIADILRQLLVRHDDLKESTTTMGNDLKSILAKLTQQGVDIAVQGKQIDQLIAARDAQEQADLDKIDSLLDTNATAAAANAAKLVSALGGSSSGDDELADPTQPITTNVTVPTSAGSTTIPVSQVAVDAIAAAVDTATAAGTTATISGPGIATGAAVTSVDPATATITIDMPTTADHTGDGSETLVVTPATS